jgi:hypothetical protein
LLPAHKSPLKIKLAILARLSIKGLNLMIENQTSHTFIVTIDRKTALGALKNSVVETKIAEILTGLGMTRANLKLAKPDGLYYSITHKG